MVQYFIGAQAAGNVVVVNGNQCLMINILVVDQRQFSIGVRKIVLTIFEP